MKKLISVFILSLSLACSHNPKVQTVEIKVPVPVQAVPPPELLAPLNAQIPFFISPIDPKASSALDQENERIFRALINDLLARIAAWQAWATTPPPVQ